MWWRSGVSWDWTLCPCLTIPPSVCLPVYPWIRLSPCLSVCLSVSLFICLPCLSPFLPACPPVSLSVCLSPCLSVCQGVMESFLGTALAGTVFCVFGGQPLIILSSTGPILIFEKLLYDFSK